MSYNLFVDDEKDPEHVFRTSVFAAEPDPWEGLEWVVVRNFWDFKDAVRTRGVPERVAFDYDLGRGPKKGGTACIKTLALYCRREGVAFPSYRCISSLPDFNADLEEAITDAKLFLSGMPS